VDSYLDALEKEIDFTAQRFYHKKLNSIYIGGGTPTTLEPYQLDRLIRKIRCSFDLSHCVEFTVEAGRPDSITREKLLALRKNGITRISVNPQTMKQATLDLIGRHHTVEQTSESFRLARELGFDNINMDLIIGLPDEDIEDVRHTM
jgi:oxygen-independent coproporphyrinogen-3 oxidase